MRSPLSDLDTHISSHWRHYGPQGRGFGAVQFSSTADRIATALERATYWRITQRFPAYRRLLGLARGVAAAQGWDFTRDVWRQLMVLCVLDAWWTRPPRALMVIGDGHGVLGRLLRAWAPESTLYCVDLPEQLARQRVAHQMTPDRTHFLLPTDVAAGPPTDRIDGAVSVCAFQEMPAASIAMYFDVMRRTQSVFYCVSREHKVLIGGEVVAFASYPWSSSDTILLDERCPFYLRVVTARRPWGRFDGPHRHRLVRLSPAPHPQ